MKVRAALLTLAVMGASASDAAVYNAAMPTVCWPAGQNCQQAAPVANPDGTFVAAGGGGGGGGAVTAASGSFVDGFNPNLGTISDAAYTGTGNASLTAIEKGLFVRLGTIAGTVQTAGSTAPTAAQQIGGKNPTGNIVPAAFATNGGLLPGQAVPTSVRTTTTAGVATSVDIARSGRLALEVQFEGSPTANAFICLSATTTCSATVYDKMIPSGATAGTLYTPPFAHTGTVYIFSSAAAVVNVSSYLAQ